MDDWKQVYKRLGPAERFRARLEIYSLVAQLIQTGTIVIVAAYLIL